MSQNPVFKKTKYLVISMTAFLIMMVFPIISINVSADVSNYVWVDDDFNSSTSGWGVDHFNIIQDGVDNVDEEGTVYIFNGTYSENVVIMKSMTLEGEDSDTTILHGNSTGYGIYAYGISDLTIRNLQIKGFYYGIYLSDSISSMIIDNIVTNNSYSGITLVSSGSSTITGNIVTGSTVGNGISLVSSGSSSVTENTVNGNWYGSCISLYSSGSSIIKSNLVSNGDNGIYLLYSGTSTVKSNTVTDNGCNGIFLYYSSSSFVICNIVRFNNNNGICFLNSAICKINENMVTNNVNGGIVLGNSGSSSVIGNNVTDNNYFGIYLFSSSSSLVIDNKVIRNHYYGITLTYLDSSTVKGNLIIKSETGIVLYVSNCTISDNKINSNYFGIDFEQSNTCNVNKNYLNENLYGLRFYYSYNNSYYYNNFINNANQLYDVYEGDGSSYKKNIWDDGNGKGNYWSDYSGYDDGSDGRVAEDGVGDTDLPHQGVDYYPLMNLWNTNQKPIADANGPYSNYEGSEITFNANKSFDPDGYDFQYRWDLDNDGIWDTNYSYDPIINYTWYDDHSGYVTVEVFDGISNDTDTVEVTIYNVDPIVSFEYTVPEMFVLQGDRIYFTGEFSDPGTEDTHTINWSFGDGNNLEGDLEVNHSFDDPGTYNITLTVTDDDGGVGEYTITITVIDQVGALEDLIDFIEGLDLKNGNSFITMLEKAIEKIEKGKDVDLHNFFNHLDAQKGKSLTDEEYYYIYDLAQRIIDSME